MNDTKTIRDELIFLLKKGNAHMSFDEAVENFPANLINEKLSKSPYSAWELLEHLRLTQKDIINFIINKDYKEPKWPEEYWPKKDKKATKEDYELTVKLFKKDLNMLVKLVKNPKTDLTAKVPWGEGQTLIREILVVADHNAYELGEFAIMRQVMGTWGKRR